MTRCVFAILLAILVAIGLPPLELPIPPIPPVPRPGIPMPGVPVIVYALALPTIPPLELPIPPGFPATPCPLDVIG